MATRALAPDEVAELEEQRDFLLASLDDLEQEHAAGDIDEHDYSELRDDYTARAARVIRALDAHRARVRPARSPRARWRMLGVVGGVVAFALLAGFLVADASGRRRPGDNLTGDIRESTQEKLEEAAGLVREQRYDDAIAVYDEVLDQQPDNVEAMTNKGWIQYQAGDQGAAVSTLTQAVELDPEYPDVHFFLAMILARLGRTDTALLSVERVLALDPPPALAEAAQALKDQLTATAP